MTKHETQSHKDQLRKRGVEALKSGKPIKKCPPSKRHTDRKRVRHTGYFSRMSGKVS